MQRLEVSGAVRPIYGSLGVKRLIYKKGYCILVLNLRKLGSLTLKEKCRCRVNKNEVCVMV